MVSTNELRQTLRATLGVGGILLVVLNLVTTIRVRVSIARSLIVVINIFALIVVGNTTPDSNRFSMSGQTNIPLQQTYVRNERGGNESPGNFQFVLKRFLFGLNI